MSDIEDYAHGGSPHEGREEHPELYADGLDHLKRLGESTSARLRRVEQERDEANELTDKIAAELRLVTRERDSLARRCTVRFEETQALQAEVVQAIALGGDYARERDEAIAAASEADATAEIARDELATTAERFRITWGLERDAQVKLRQRLLAAEAELASARTELEQLRYSGWQVARADGPACERCGQQIRRSEAYWVDTTADQQRHIHCPEGVTA